MIFKRKNKTNKTIHEIVAFIPFGIILVQRAKPVMPLRWILLVISLEVIAIATIFTNIVANDPVWALFGVWAFIIVCRPIYFTFKQTKSNNPKPSKVVNPSNKVNQTNTEKLTFKNLFNLCAKTNFSNYRIGLLSSVPLVVQALVGGSIIYTLFGGDWVMHYLAGIGIGAMAFLAYRTSLDKYGYKGLHEYFRLDSIHLPKTERKTGSLEFVIFSIIIVALIWELLEYSIVTINPENVWRVHVETTINRGMDFGVAILGAITAWYLIKYKFKWFTRGKIRSNIPKSTTLEN